MRTWLWAEIAATALPTIAQGQVEQPDFRIRAEFRDPQGESIGNATVKVISRFMQVYYGGVRRSDEYRFQVSLDWTAVANRLLDVKVDDFLVGMHTPNSSGFLDVTYRSDWKPDDLPDLKLPAEFPDPIDVGNTDSIFDATTHELLLTSVFGEEFERGDADHDNDVDDDDLVVWSSSYGSNGMGPASGDYTGDNRADGGDLMVWQRNYSGPSGGGNFASVPEPHTATLCLTACRLAGWRRLRHRGRNA